MNKDINLLDKKLIYTKLIIFYIYYMNFAITNSILYICTLFVKYKGIKKILLKYIKEVVL